MVEFKIQLEDNFVQSLGRQEIERYIQEFIKKITLQLAAKDVLKDLDELNIVNDKDWHISRNLAWEQEKHRYFPDL